MIHIFFMIHFALQSEPVCSAQGKAILDTLTCSFPSAENIQKKAALPFVPGPVGAMVHVPVVTFGCETGRQDDGLDFNGLLYLPMSSPTALCVFRAHRSTPRTGAVLLEQTGFLFLRTLPQ